MHTSHAAAGCNLCPEFIAGAAAFLCDEFDETSRMNHYTYKLTALNPVDERLYYIGVRSCACDPAEDAYMSSSSSVKSLLKDGVVFKKKILSVWPTRKAAVEHEIALHELHDVARSPSFFNKAKQTSAGFDITGNSETAQKIAAAALGREAWNKGVPRTDEVRAALRCANLGKVMPFETKVKISDSLKGRTATEEHKEKARVGLRNYYATRSEAEREQHASAIKRSTSTPEESARRSALASGNKNFAGRKHSEATLAKMREAGKNRMRTPASRDAVSAVHKGKVVSADSRAKISAARRGTRLVTDGVVTRCIATEDPLPAGFRYGMTKKQRSI